MRATDLAIRTLAAGDANMLREMLHLFGQLFEEPETYGGQQPDDAYLLRLPSRDSFVAIAALRDGGVVGSLQPEHHSVHHQLGVHDDNDGDITWWDRLFGTFKDTDAFTERCGFPGRQEE